jgi:hypothetical protein
LLRERNVVKIIDFAAACLLIIGKIIHWKAMNRGGEDWFMDAVKMQNFAVTQYAFILGIYVLKEYTFSCIRHICM